MDEEENDGNGKFPKHFKYALDKLKKSGALLKINLNHFMLSGKVI